MNLETLTVTLNADASQYNAALDSAASKSAQFAAKFAATAGTQVRKMFKDIYEGTRGIKSPDQLVEAVKIQAQSIAKLQEMFRRQQVATQKAEEKFVSQLSRLRATSSRLGPDDRLAQAVKQEGEATLRKIAAMTRSMAVNAKLLARAQTEVSAAAEVARVFTKGAPGAHGRIPKGGSPLFPGQKPGTITTPFQEIPMTPGQWRRQLREQWAASLTSMPKTEGGRDVYGLARLRSRRVGAGMEELLRLNDHEIGQEVKRRAKFYPTAIRKAENLPALGVYGAMTPGATGAAYSPQIPVAGPDGLIGLSDPLRPGMPSIEAMARFVGRRRFGNSRYENYGKVPASAYSQPFVPPPGEFSKNPLFRSAIYGNHTVGPVPQGPGLVGRLLSRLYKTDPFFNYGAFDASTRYTSAAFTRDKLAPKLAAAQAAAQQAGKDLMDASGSGRPDKATYARFMAAHKRMTRLQSAYDAYAEAATRADADYNAEAAKSPWQVLAENHRLGFARNAALKTGNWLAAQYDKGYTPGAFNRWGGRQIDVLFRHARGFGAGFMEGYRGMRGGSGGGYGGGADVGIGTYGVPTSGGRIRMPRIRFPKDGVDFPILEYPRDKIRLRPPTKSAIKEMFAAIRWPILTIPGDKVKIGDVPAANVKVKGKVKIKAEVEVDPKKDVKVTGGKKNAARSFMPPIGMEAFIGGGAGSGAGLLAMAKTALFGGAALATGGYMGNPKMRQYINDLIGTWVTSATTTKGMFGRGAAAAAGLGLAGLAAYAMPMTTLAGAGIGHIFNRGVGKTAGELFGFGHNQLSNAWSAGGRVLRTGTSLGGGFLGAISGIASGTNPVYQAMIGASGPMGAVLVTTQALSSATERLGRAVVKLGADYQDAQVAFSVFAGSEKTGQAMLDQIQQFAIATPFKMDELTQAARTLAGYGVSMENVLPVLKSLGEVSAGLGAGPEKLQRLALAYGQVVAAGRFMATERRQFTEAGVAVEDFAQSMGVTTTEFVHMMEEGKVSSQDMMKAFNDMTGVGGRFQGMMERLSRNVHGRWNALVETLQMAGQRVGLAFFKGFRLTELLDDLRKFATGALTDVDALVPYFEKLRFIFDMTLATVKELGLTTGQWIQRTLEGLGVTMPKWGEFKEFVTDTASVITVMFHELLNGINKLIGAIGSRLLRPIGSFFRGMGQKDDDMRFNEKTGRWEHATDTTAGDIGFRVKQHFVTQWLKGIMGWDDATVNLFKDGMTQFGDALHGAANNLERFGNVFSEKDVQAAINRIRQAALPKDRTGRVLDAAKELMAGNKALPFAGMSPAGAEAELLANLKNRFISGQQQPLGATGAVLGVLGAAALPQVNPQQTANGLFQGLGAVMGMGGAFGLADTNKNLGIGQARIRLGPKPEDVEFAQNVKKDMDKGTEPYKEFLNTMTQIRRAGGQAHGALGGGPLVGIMGAMTGAQADQARFDAFEKLRKAVGRDRGEAQLPTALVRGSAEERAELAKLQNESISIEEEIRQTLKDALAEQEAQTRYQEKVVDVLRDIERKGGIVGGKI